MDRYARGDDSAFGEVYDAVGPRVLGFLLRRTRDRAVAEELTQQAFLQMHVARATFIPGADVTAWSFAIARCLLIDRQRRAWREVLQDEPLPAEARDPAPDEALQGTQAAARLEKTLASLPESQRVAFELLKLDGLTLAQAAQALGTTVTAVKLRAHRAYEALRAALGEPPEDP